ncbi:MAG: hypothetical protein WBK08_02115 [Nitrospira sp.]|nr:MAG: hypothetical protein E8D42_14540 [Nitrospira sp.]
MIDSHPWQRGPRELFQFAITAYASPDEAGRRISFLLIDVCVETTLRTFLGLPVKISGSGKEYSDLKQYANGTFHNLTKGVEAAAPGRIPDDELHHLRFYHNVRNRLYHEGNGITIPEEHVRGYGTLAAKLLKELLGIDGHALLSHAWKQVDPTQSHALDEMRRDLERELDQFKHAINAVMEKIAPKMVYPSTIRRLKELADFTITTFGSDLGSFRDLINKNLTNQKAREWLLKFLADDLSYDSPQVIANSQLIMELAKDSTAFYSFLVGMQFVPIEDISMDTLDHWDDISFIQQAEYSILGVYESAKHFFEILRDKHWFGMSETELLERCKDLRDKLKMISPKVAGLHLPN